MAPFDVDLVRADFPLLARRERGKPLAYLDSAASAQKPRAVIEAVSRYYSEQHANIHRGLYRLSEEATALFEASRAEVARFLRAPDPRGIVFVRGATEAINLVADSSPPSAPVPASFPARSLPAARSTSRPSPGSSARAPGWPPSRTSPTPWAPSTPSPR
jgi:selenocysteine lyase/cysteine desulfurase